MQDQIITFGLHLDGQRGVRAANRLGEITVGPLGLLGILETQLGLTAPSVSQAERTVQYRECLARIDAPGRFFHASFATDALGTAATLLAWRDLWIVNGWTGNFAGTVPDRLADLVAAEAEARDRLAPGPGDRLAAILVALGERRPAIGALRLVDPVSAFPVRWQEVLARLPTHPLEARADQSTGLLKDLQSGLRELIAGEKVNPLGWVDDGTLTIVQSETRLTAGAWLASRLESNPDLLIVADQEGSRLDASLAGAGRPRHGLQESSPFRPALQALPLALEILWEPLNFYGLIQFLTHPVCPIPGFARHALAVKTADTPGIGGRVWDAVLLDIDAHYGPERAVQVREVIAQWLQHARFKPELGAPIVTVRTRVDALAAFFQRRLGTADPAERFALAAGYAQCVACSEALQLLHEQGLGSIRRPQLQTLVAQATAQGTDNPLWHAEVGAHLAVTRPGAAIEAVDQVVWWQLAMPTLPAPYPWSNSELSALAACGVTLPDSDQRLRQAAADWLRPILAARRQLTLILPPDAVERHPLWQMISALLKEPVIGRLEDQMKVASALVYPVTPTPLPSRQRWWQLSADVTIPHRPQESFSSLETLLFNPFAWVLKYPAQLRPSRVLTLDADFRMIGSLAHGLVERLYQREDALTLSDGAFQTWFEQTFETLIDEEGAILRMAGRRARLEYFRLQLRHAVTTLRNLLIQVGSVWVQPEAALTGHYVGGTLAGSADLVVRTNQGASAIVDMKWAGIKKFPQKLQENGHLQLAIYAELLRQQEGAWPSVAYFIFDRARLYAADDRVFPARHVIAAASGENTAQLYQRFLVNLAWRRAQIDAGRIEVALEDIAATPESSPPADGMPPEYLNENYNDYLHLAGWEV